MFAFSFLLPVLAPVGALPADVKAQSSTRCLWYFDLFQDKPHLYESPDESATEF